LLAQNPVLLEQVLNHLLLAAIHPPGDGGDAKLEAEIVRGQQASAVQASVDGPAQSCEKQLGLGSAEF
jgi:hypothetical protein